MDRWEIEKRVLDDFKKIILKNDKFLKTPDIIEIVFTMLSKILFDTSDEYSKIKDFINNSINAGREWSLIDKEFKYNNDED